jgi:hypothetical protein
MPRDHIRSGRLMSLVGPLPRWRSPDLAAAYWGGPAATVASGPQGHAPDWREGQLPQDRGRGPQAPVAARAPSGGPGWSVPARWRRLCRREQVLVLSLAKASAWLQAASADHEGTTPKRR